MNRDLAPKFKLVWQQGYGVLALREGNVPTVSRYIDQQEEHHLAGKLSVLLERTDDDAPREAGP